MHTRSHFGAVTGKDISYVWENKLLSKWKIDRLIKKTLLVYNEIVHFYTACQNNSNFA